MSEPSLPNPASTDELQFATAEPGSSNVSAATSEQNCVLCRQPIVSTYFALGDKVLCPACCEQVNAPVAGSRFGRLVKATFMGAGAGLVGALIWFVIRRVAHLEIGLIAILVGLMVGKAVRKGSGGQGGLGYQILAVAITYSFIAANYMPDILEQAFKAAREANAKIAAPQQADAKPREASAENGTDDGAKADPVPAARPKIGTGELIVALATLLAIVFAVSLAAPFLAAGAQNLIGLLIIGFALWEAWKINSHRPLPISGPYQMRSLPEA